jgi:hypothetical protein
MSRAIVTINREYDRMRAANWINTAPIGTRIEFKDAKRTPEQNERMWAMLTDIATQVIWDGEKKSTSDWKDGFMDWLPRELRTMSALDGSGRQVPLGRSTSDLSKQEMSDLLVLMEMFGARHGVKFNDPEI